MYAYIARTNTSGLFYCLRTRKASVSVRHYNNRDYNYTLWILILPSVTPCSFVYTYQRSGAIYSSLYLGQILLNQIVAYRYVKHKIFMNALDEIEKDTYYLEEQNIDGL